MNQQDFYKEELKKVDNEIRNQKDSYSQYTVLVKAIDYYLNNATLTKDEIKDAKNELSCWTRILERKEKESQSLHERKQFLERLLEERLAA